MNLFEKCGSGNHSIAMEGLTEYIEYMEEEDDKNNVKLEEEKQEYFEEDLKTENEETKPSVNHFCDICCKNIQKHRITL